MRFRTLEIRWHDSKPISTCDFQPASFKKARPSPGQEQNFAGHSYRLATGGEDNHVRIWMVHPNLRPTCVADSDLAVARPPRIEYLSTLSRHSAAVNVVRFSPNGELIASAGDDGMIIIWAQSNTPQASTYGSDLSPEDLQHEKEFWKPRTTFRCTTMQVYDLAWSPTGEFLIAGSTDNAARVFASADGKCVHEIAEHNHYVQGVAWDPLNEYIATQSSDRSMHIYKISIKQGSFEAHAVGKNSRMPHRRHSRTPSSHGRPRMFRRESTASDAESAISDFPREKDENASSVASTSGHSQSQTQYSKDATPLTPATSVASTPSMFPPPSIEKSSSRRSSFSSTNAPGSPSTFGRYARSPSPMPALPAIRTLPPSGAWSSVKLYGDESFSNFFRRLTFSPDGGLLLTPAGQFEDPSVVPGKLPSGDESTTPSRGRTGRLSVSTADLPSSTSSASSVYIYSRANFARPPIAQLPGHKKASVAVKFNPILFELRPGVIGADTQMDAGKTAVLERGMDGVMEVDIGPMRGTAGGAEATLASASSSTPQRTPSSQTPSQSSSHLNIAAPAPLLAGSGATFHPVASPAISPIDLRPPTPAASKPSTPIQRPHTPLPHGTANNAGTGAIFALPYRMLFAVVTMDAVAIYDTQQAGPVCLLTKLHYDEFTDLSWSPDGQCLILSSRDGYCTLIMFDEILAAHHTQQHALQMQSIAHQHSVPLITTTPSHSLSVAGTPLATPSSASIGLPLVVTPSVVPAKRSEPPLTPAASVDGGEQAGPSGLQAGVQVPTEGLESAGEVTIQEPPKKKRRVALTRVGDIN
ncbi:hypothetical protein HGRIS_012114 [Hohenbuehelia grisea]|uniref:CAF1B/HIR1 beta-propeller domain-containing protein n=1 Tax=Hohenbuehelia grisea TaxID=104357 RepID=A0ABR3IRB4_9AGAR